MKTVIHVFKQNIKQINSDGLNYDTMVGLGDCLRGTLTLYRLSKILNFNLIIDIRHHPISNFLVINNNIHEKIIDENIDNFKFFFLLENLKKYLEFELINNNSIYLHTNAIWNSDEITYNNNLLNNDEQNFLKNILIPNNDFNNYINQKIFNLSENFNIIHFRIGDSKSFNNTLTDEELIFYENIFKKYYETNDVLISDNIIFKNYIKLKYDINSYDTKICHLGNSNSSEEVKDTLFDFFLISKSKKVKTFTNYPWISGFIQWNSNIYDIPIIQMK